MCFALYIAADREIPIIPLNANDPCVHTRDLTVYDEAVAVHFTERFKKYVGSDQGCGCGFRHVMFQNGQWPEEAMIGGEEYSGEEQQPNHLQLYELISEVFRGTDQVELYGCWEGDFAEPSAGCSEIPLSRVIDSTFFFRERSIYKVTKGGEDWVGKKARPQLE